jgi:AcrR family transcriptional regulator
MCFAGAVTTADSAAQPAPPRQARAVATRRRIVEAAVHEFAARPYNDVAAGDIAERAGVAHGLVFHHFGSKRGVYLEAVREISARLFDVVPRDPSAPPGEQLRDVLRQHFARVAEHEDLLLGYVRGSVAMSGDPEAWDVLEGYRQRVVDWVCDAVGVDRDNAAMRIMLRTAGDALDQLSVRWVQQGRRFGIERLVEAMVHVVTGSLAGARALDPGLDLHAGIELLGDSSA